MYIVLEQEEVLGTGAIVFLFCIVTNSLSKEKLGYTLPTDQLFNLEFQFESVFKENVAVSIDICP